MNKITYIAVVAAVFVTAADAATEQTVASIDSGGQRVTGGTVVLDGTCGGTGGLSTDGGSSVGKMGYAGQLYDLSSLQVDATTTNVDEGATSQLSAVGKFDDDTYGALQGAPVWTAVSGPILSINGAGLLTASNVYQTTAAMAQGVSEGATGTVALLVADSDTDNYGTYSGDGMSDNWQIMHWGVDNADAAADADPDFDGQSNLYEYVVGTLPTNVMSFFDISIYGVVGVSTQMDILFNPTYVDRTYTVEATDDLTGGGWNPVASYTVTTNGTVQTVRDLIATNPPTFYRVKVLYTP